MKNTKFLLLLMNSIAIGSAYCEENGKKYRARIIVEETEQSSDQEPYKFVGNDTSFELLFPNAINFNETTYKDVEKSLKAYCETNTCPSELMNFIYTLFGLNKTVAPDVEKIEIDNKAEQPVSE